MGSVHQSSEIKVIYIDEIIAEKDNKERDFLGVQQVPPCGGGRSPTSESHHDRFCPSTIEIIESSISFVILPVRHTLTELQNPQGSMLRPLIIRFRRKAPNFVFPKLKIPSRSSLCVTVDYSNNPRLVAFKLHPLASNWRLQHCPLSNFFKNSRAQHNL
jgi:hypothetical protein